MIGVTAVGYNHTLDLYHLYTEHALLGCHLLIGGQPYSASAAVAGNIEGSRKRIFQLKGAIWAQIYMSSFKRMNASKD